MSGSERMDILKEQISQSTSSKQLINGIEIFLYEFEDSFGVSDKELFRTILVEKKIDTGSCAPIKTRTRSEPLSVRTKLREVSNDPTDRRSIVEKSDSS